MDEVERQRAMETFVGMLKSYLNASEAEESSRHLPLQGQILGRMVPRCSDPSLYIRQTAIDCIQLTLRIATCMPGTKIAVELVNPFTQCLLAGVQDSLVDALSLLRERAEQDEPNSLFSLINDLSKVLCKKISGENLWTLVQYLLEGLIDFQGHSSSGACVVLNQVVKLRGKSLEEQVAN